MQDSPAPSAVRPPTALAVFWIVAGLFAGATSFLLYLEYIGQLTGTDALVSCELSVVVTCGPNLLSPGGNLLGFSNAILGITLFLGPLFAGVGALASPAGMRRWYWRVYSLFVLGGFLFVHFLAYRSIFEYGSLCPWCMTVWLATIPLFWFTAGWTLREGVWGDAAPVRRVGAGLYAWALLATVLDYALIAVLAQVRLDVLGSFF